MTPLVVDRSSLASMKNGAQIADYQRQITRTPELSGKLMIEYFVARPGVKHPAEMDGCAFWAQDKALLDAKFGGHGAHVAAQRSGSDVFREAISAERQADHYEKVIGREHPVHYVLSDERMVPIIAQQVLEGSRQAPNFSVTFSPHLDVNR